MFELTLQVQWRHLSHCLANYYKLYQDVPITHDTLWRSLIVMWQSWILQRIFLALPLKRDSRVYNGVILKDHICLPVTLGYTTWRDKPSSPNLWRDVTLEDNSPRTWSNPGGNLFPWPSASGRCSDPPSARSASCSTSTWRPSAWRSRPVKKNGNVQNRWPGIAK